MIRGDIGLVSPMTNRKRVFGGDREVAVRAKRVKVPETQMANLKGGGELYKYILLKFSSAKYIC